MADTPVLPGWLPVSVGTFTFDASSSTTTVSDSHITTNSQVVIFPANATAGLQLRSYSIYVDTVAAGSFVANFSATAAGAPAAASTWSYIVIDDKK
jgi:hypothetical protein